MMKSIPAHNFAEKQRKNLWQIESIGYLLAMLAHAVVWQIYKLPPPPRQEAESPIIEARLVVQHPAAIAFAPAQPQPVITPLPPLSKPAPKVEKPNPKKNDKPTPKPVSMPIPKPVRKPAPHPLSKPLQRPILEQPEESEPNPSLTREGVNQVQVNDAASAPSSAARATQESSTVPAENSEYHLGRVSGFGRSKYPNAAKDRGWEGTVTLKVHILADGEIGEVIVTGSSGHDILDEAAADMVKEARATPARRGDKPVDSWVVVPYRFRLEN